MSFLRCHCRRRRDTIFITMPLARQPPMLSIALMLAAFICITPAFHADAIAFFRIYQIALPQHFRPATILICFLRFHADTAAFATPHVFSHLFSRHVAPLRARSHATCTVLLYFFLRQPQAGHFQPHGHACRQQSARRGEAEQRVQRCRKE